MARLRARWLRRQPAADEKVLASMARLPVVPTGFGFALGVVLAVMFVWSANHQLNLGYALTFLVAVLALLAAAMTVGQLAGLRLQLADAAPVFAGEVARFPLRVAELDGRVRSGLTFVCGGREVRLAGLAAGGAETVWLELETALARGWQAVEAVDVQSRQPLGWFLSWQWLRLTARVLVYPVPHGDLPLPFVASARAGMFAAEAAGEDELAGLVPYHVGDSLSRVAWKRSGRDGGWLVKRFVGEGAPEVMLDYAALRGDAEMRLSQLCQWVLEADRAGLRYALHLPGQVFAADGGVAHRERCLQALALF
ncbi:MAG: DUF58 domain-containing protein [Cardiobacteriaceae bacterium]|nr:DUF58 domain-containing protein [Cardiobacteriaceae bacterium]